MEVKVNGASGGPQPLKHALAVRHYSGQRAVRGQACGEGTEVSRADHDAFGAAAPVPAVVLDVAEHAVGRVLLELVSALRQVVRGGVEVGLGGGDRLVEGQIVDAVLVGEGVADVAARACDAHRGPCQHLGGDLG